MAEERGCGLENGCQGTVAVAGGCGVGSWDGLVGGLGGDRVWGGGAVGGMGVEGVEVKVDGVERREVGIIGNLIDSY